MATGTHTLLERITVGAAGAASVTFSSIPQTGYTDLKIVMSIRTNVSGLADDVFLAFNGSTSTFSGKYLQGTGSSTVSGSYARFAGFGTGNTATSSTFSNQEVLIPNYTSTNYKSYSVDSVSENNGTTGQMAFVAGLWSTGTAISSIAFTPVSGTAFLQYSTFSLYGIAASGTTPTKAPKAVGGDIIQTDGTYWYHAFINTGAFVPATGLTADVLVVAGGGGGAGSYGAGAGAGGFRTATGLSISSGTNVTVTVGSGGAGGAYTPGIGTKGNDSTFSTITSTGGGPASPDGYNGSAGGSGSGATRGGTVGSGNQGGYSPVEGYAGGTGVNSAPNYTSGGGGGAGAVGVNASSASVSGSGGIGSYTVISGGATTGLGQLSSGNYYFAGGGGGGTYQGGTSGSGGIGGGGAGGAAGTTSAGANGTANTGGGGGGASYQSAPQGANVGGTGGSGVVIVRYLA